MKEPTRTLFTPRGEALRAALAEDPSLRPWDVYPRPRLVRAGWINLNGPWDFGAAAADAPVFDRTVLVPFPPGSPLSGVPDFDAGRTPWLFYRRCFRLEALPAGKQLLLHCGGADQCFAAVRFNGRTLLTEHSPLLDGPLCLRLPDPLPGENELELTVRDVGGTDFPWGKQRKKRGGMWYTPVSGIWQTVWLEWVPRRHVTELRCTPGLEEAAVEVLCADGPAPEGAFVRFEGRDWPLRAGRAVLRPAAPRRWTPEDPFLYEFEVRCGEDRVRSRFALRTVSVGLAEGIPRLLLNGKPCFFNGLLDQGYWPDGLWTPADPACFEDDLRLAKALGFNMVRKHIKLEPELFYDACDRLGVAVFQDLINCGPYSFLRDTVLPTLGLQRLPQLLRCRSKPRLARFFRHMETAVRTLWSHPSVLYWTVYNEGWGQQYTARAYEKLKALDPTRIVDTASGWFRTRHSDVESRHVYFRRFRLPRSDRPVVLSEFGGYVWKDPDHSFNPDRTYGYRSFEDRAAWEAAFRALYADQIDPAIPRGLCAAVYTQLSDVEDETNGLVTFDRKTVKLKIES